MYLNDASAVEPEVVHEGIRIRWLLTQKEGAPNFAMRDRADPGVVFAPHHHPYEHEIYVLGGSGVVTNPDGDAGEMLLGGSCWCHRMRSTAIGTPGAIP